MMEAIRLLHTFAETINPHLGKRMHQTALLGRNVAQSLGIEETQQAAIEMAAMIHDVGLLAMPGELQNMDVKLLSESQYRDYCEHPVTAAVVLESIETLAEVGEIVLHHHEQMGGGGFPSGLKGSDIPIGSRILHVVSDYCKVTMSWPKDNLQKAINFARRHLAAEDWKSFTSADDPKTVVETSALKLLLKDPDEKYDVRVVKALVSLIHKTKNIDPAYMVALDKLKSGMVLMEDLRTEAGRLLLSKGKTLNAAAIQTLTAVADQGLIPNEIYVSVPEK